MRILYIMRSMAMVAGTERVVSDKLNWLAEHGYDITLITYEQGEHPLVFPLHPTINVIDLGTKFYTLNRISLPRRIWAYQQMKSLFATRLQKVVDKFVPDIIITTSYSLIIANVIARVGRNAKLIMESHETCFSVGKEFSRRSHRWLRMLAHLYDKYHYHKMSRFDLLVTLTKGDASEWRKYFSRIEVVPNPLTYYPKVLGEKEEKSCCRIITAGRLEPVKGFDLLIDAFSLIAHQCPQWHIDIYGKGSCGDELLRQIRSKGLENRVYINSPTSSIYDEFRQSEFYVLSSRHEGLGMVMLEAMSCETPCVAFRCEYGPEEVINHQETGLLVKNGDTQELANVMLWMIEHPQERKEMGKRARKAVGKYEKEKIMHTWEELFNSLLFPRH